MAQYQYGTYKYSNYDPTKVKGYSGENGVLEKKTGAQSNYDTWVNTGYTASDAVNAAYGKKTSAEQGVDKFGSGFTYSKDGAYNEIMKRILNREDFSYDMNSDALYQQYKDKYIQQGQMAMADTMGQAAAMTGGYGNSYATSVGNQAYLSSLQQLNDVIPELYQMAYDRYNQQGQDLYNQYGMLSNDKTTEYGMWNDGYNRAVADRDYYSNNYNTEYNRDYGQWMDKGNILSGERDYWSGEENTLYDRGYNEHINTENSKSKAIDDENAYNKWEAETELQESQFRRSLNNSSKTTTSTPSLTPGEYNDVMENAGVYAEQGEGALANYLNGLVDRGYISGDEAGDILEQFFPAKLPGANPGRVGGGGGGKSGIEHTLN